MIWIGLLLVLVFLAVSRAPDRYRLALWTIVIIGCVAPWVGFQEHPHWARVVWVPFASGPLRLRDLGGNLALYVPFGLFFIRRDAGHRWTVVLAVVAAVALSLVTEATQVYSHGRFPTMTDVVMNGIGAGIGGLVGLWRIRRSRALPGP